MIDPMMMQDATASLAQTRANQFQQTLSVSQVGNDDDKLMEVCRDFEALFIKQVLDAMRKTIPRSDFIKRNRGEEIFEDMLYDEYSKKIAQTDSLGISKMLFEQLSI